MSPATSPPFKYIKPLRFGVGLSQQKCTLTHPTSKIMIELSSLPSFPHKGGRVWLPKIHSPLVYYGHPVKTLSVPLGPRSSGCLFHELWSSRRGCPLGSKLGDCSLSSGLREASNTGTGSAQREEDRGGGSPGGQGVPRLRPQGQGAWVGRTIHRSHLESLWWLRGATWTFCFMREQISRHLLWRAGAIPMGVAVLPSWE